MHAEICRQMSKTCDDADQILLKRKGIRLMNHELVSVIMPVYNPGKFLSKSINSILSQTYKNIQLVIIDDGSNRETKNALSTIIDKRVKIISNDKNMGLVTSLNVGIQNCDGNFIARMDADDISMIDRIEKQVNYLLKNNEIGVLGTHAQIINSNGKVVGSLKPVRTHSFISSNLLFGSCIIHPTVMFNLKNVDRKDLQYNENFKHAEDYELWLRLIKKYKFQNINLQLLQYRKHNSNISKIFAQEQFDSTMNARFAHYPCSTKKINTSIFKTLRDDEYKLSNLVSLIYALLISRWCGDITSSFLLFKLSVITLKVFNRRNVNE